ncbi:MAG: aromatic-L-amino-acid decarboxylase [Enterobacterales bacterium]|jgi:aromatic-L-amino-acid decarboxylase
MDYKLEPSTAEVQAIMDLTTRKIIDFLDNIATPIELDLDKASEDAFKQSEALPEIETPFNEILDDLFDNKIPQSLPAASPGFMAYIPGGGLFHSAVAELIAQIANRYVGIDFTAPFLVQIEVDVIKWFCEMVGYCDKAAGTLTSGGSIANLTAVICARTYLLGDDFSKGIVYASAFTHHSNWKAFQAAGIPAKNIRLIPVDKKFRLDIQHLEKQLQQDVDDGFIPLMVVASAGSTNTGTIDQLEYIAQLSKQHGAWYHIDAAYGGFFTLCDSMKSRLKGIELADSITLDPHKSLFLPYGTGAIIVKDRAKLEQVFKHSADYIQDDTVGYDNWDFSEMSLELTRPFRGLGVWLPFKMLGADAFRKALTEKIELAQYFCEKIKQDTVWKIIAEPELSLTVFRYDEVDKTIEELNDINQKIITLVNNKGRVNISGTKIDGYFVLRSCILSFRTHESQVTMLLEDLTEAVKIVMMK